eukprot:scaffold49094_cov27-Tisochrysis_lutea.AAC.1
MQSRQRRRPEFRLYGSSMNRSAARARGSAAAVRAGRPQRPACWHRAFRGRAEVGWGLTVKCSRPANEPSETERLSEAGYRSERGRAQEERIKVSGQKGLQSCEGRAKEREGKRKGCTSERRAESRRREKTQRERPHSTGSPLHPAAGQQRPTHGIRGFIARGRKERSVNDLSSL